MNRSKTLWIGVAAFAVFLIASVFAYRALSAGRTPENLLNPDAAVRQSTPESGEEEAPAAGDAGVSSEPEKVKAPDFTVLDADGNKTKLSDLYGKPVVLNFWASWCPPCRSEMPHFESVYKEMGGDISFMMVDLVGGRETKENGEKYIAQQGFTFPVYYDVDAEAAIAYGVTSIPSTLFIDGDGYIVTGAQGAIDEATLRYGIELLQAAADPASSDE